MLTALFLIVGGFAFAGGEQEAATSESTGKTQITFLSNASFPYDQAVPKMIGMFEQEYPNISVQADYNPYRKILEIVELKLGAKEDVPDVLFTDVPLVSAYAVKGYIDQLDSYFSKQEINDWVQPALEASTIDGKLMTAPLNNSTQLLYYNTKFFEEAGLPMLGKKPEDRITWEQLAEMGKKLTKDNDGDGTPEVWGVSISQVSRPYQMLAMAESKGALPISKDGLRTQGIIDTPEWVNAYTYFQNLFNAWKIAPKGVSSSDMTNYFRSLKVATHIGIDFSASDFVKVEGLDWDYAPYPYFEGGVAATPTGSWHLGLNKYSTKKDAGIKWLRYLTTAPGAVEWFKADRHLPPNKKSLQYIQQDPMYDEWPFNLYDLAMYESENTAVPRPITPGYLEYEQLLTNAFEDIRNGADVKSTLAEAAVRIDRLLEKYK